MALKPKIYKLRIALSDLNRHYYDTLNLTVAQHPSETLERMVVRILVFCINAQEHLTFTKGLSATEEPDLWARSLDDKISLWIDVGEPSAERIKKATRVSPIVKIYSFNTKSNVWWTQGQTQFNALKASIYQLQWSNIQAFAKLVQRTMDISITITEDSSYIATELGECEIPCLLLQGTH